MNQRTLQDLAKAMAKIDFVMLQTHTATGEIAGRPMSTNGDVEYDGDSWFFTDESAHFVAEIEANPVVALSFAGAKSLLGKPPLFVAVEGRGELIRQKAPMKEHWHSELDRWFPQGVDTPGIVMLKVHATRITWWDGEEHGEIVMSSPATPRVQDPPGNQPSRRTPAEQPNQTNQPTGVPIPAQATGDEADPLAQFKNR